MIHCGDHLNAHGPHIWNAGGADLHCPGDRGAVVVPAWGELRDAAATRDGALSDLVAALDLAWVASAKIGVELADDRGGRLVGRCPFHEDTRPSFAIFWPEGGEGKARWGCWSCPSSRGVGAVGDVLDLIARWRGVGVVAAIGYARVYLREFEDLGRPVIDIDVPAVRPGLSPEALVWFDGCGSAGDVLIRLSSGRGWTFRHEDCMQLALAFDLRFSAMGLQILAPYYDDEGRVVAIKHRGVDGAGPWIAVLGSRLREWYEPWGEGHRSRTRLGAGPVLICEGESDCWTAWAAGYRVLGLPAGVASWASGALEAWLLASRVVIALDGDESGRRASRALLERLKAAGAGDVRELDVGDGWDVASRGADWLRNAVGG